MGTMSAGAARDASPFPPAWLPLARLKRSALGALSSGTLSASFIFFLFSPLISWSALFWFVGSFCLFLLSPAFRGRHRISGLCSVAASELSIVIYI